MGTTIANAEPLKIYSDIESVKEFYRQGKIIINTSMPDSGYSHYYTDNNSKDRNNGELTQIWVRHANGKKERVPTAPLAIPADIHITPDGNRLLITEYGSQQSKLYYMEQSSSGWTGPNELKIEGLPEGVAYPTTTRSGAMYFTSNSDIYRAKDNVVEKLSSKINTSEGEYDPFISKHESYLIFVRQDNKEAGDTNMYISFLFEDDWSEPERLPSPFNDSGIDGSPYVTPDNRYLFFSSNRHGEGVRTYQANLKTFIQDAKARALESQNSAETPIP